MEGKRREEERFEAVRGKKGEGAGGRERFPSNRLSIVCLDANWQIFRNNC